MASAEQQAGGDGAGKPDSRGARLWAFAVALYAQPQVARRCIALQDELAVDVNLLIYALWAATQGVGLSQADLAAAAEHCEDWRRGVIFPLRAQRRAWKASPRYGAQYTRIKALELDAERAQLEMLAALPEACGDGAPCDPASRLRHNLRAVGAHYRLEAPVLRELCAFFNAELMAAARRKLR